jgi:hypothetical protein
MPDRVRHDDSSRRSGRVKFRAALEVADPQMEDPTATIAERFRRRAGHLEYIRFLTWEAAGGRTQRIPARAVRQKRVAEFGAPIRALHANERLPLELDPALLQLAILALATCAMAFAPITGLVTGKRPTDPALQRDGYDFLRALGERLLVARTAGASGKAVKRARKRS